MSTLKGEDGHQRKELDKLMDWLDAADAGRRDPAVLAADRAGGADSRALDRPIVVTLQGEDLFLERLVEPWKREALDLIRQQIDEVDLFISISEYYTRLHVATTSASRATRCGPCRSASTSNDFSGARARELPTARGAFTIGYLARIAPEKGLHNLAEAYASCGRSAVCRRRGSGRRLDGRRSEDRISKAQARLNAAGLAASSTIAATLDRDDEGALPAPDRRALGAGGYHEPKGLYLLEAMASGVPVVQPNHGAFPEMLRKTGGGILSASEQPRPCRRRHQAAVEDPARSRRARRAAAPPASARRTRSQHMADRLLEVYRELVPGGSQRSRSGTSAATVTH